MALDPTPGRGGGPAWLTPQVRDIGVAVAIALAVIVLATLLEPNLGTGTARFLWLVGIAAGVGYFFYRRRANTLTPPR